jgi:DNA invertase Pin-like site-specific DNA recombinase
VGGKLFQLEACPEYVCEADKLVVTQFYRLARSTPPLCRIADELKRKGAELQVLDQNINTAEATGGLLFDMFGAIARFETEIRAECPLDGISKAKQKGIKFGDRRKLSDEQIEELRQKRAEGVLTKTWMKEFHLKPAFTAISKNQMEFQQNK